MKHSEPKLNKPFANAEVVEKKGDRLRTFQLREVYAALNGIKHKITYHFFKALYDSGQQTTVN